MFANFKKCLYINVLVFSDFDYNTLQFSEQQLRHSLPHSSVGDNS